MVKWDDIDTVLLDMDGTLLDLHFDNYFWQHHLPASYAHQCGISLQEAQQTVFSQFADQRATLNWYCLDYWSSQLGLDIVALKKEVQHLIAVRPGVLAFLEFLRNNQKRAVLVTNAHRGSLQLKMECTGISHWFDRLISAHDLGYPKESQAFWQTLAITEDFILDRTLFIDDTPSILEAAKRFGVGHILAIYLPDSKGEPRPLAGYLQLRDFSQLTGKF